MKLMVSLLLSLMAFSAFAQLPPHMRCKLPRSVQCENFVNSNISRWERRDSDVQRRLMNACAGNEAANCVGTSAANLPWYNVNNAEDMISVARSCQLTRSSCVNYVTSRLSRTDYNDMEDVREVNMACARADAQCVHQTCQSRAFNCNRKEDLLRAARSCFESCWPRRR